jgi:uncharacterized protein (TIGR02246 family)
VSLKPVEVAAMRQILRPALVAGAICGVGMAGCGTAPGPAAAIREQVRADEAQWNADWEAKDATRVASHYSPDAVVMVPGLAPVRGPDAIRSSLVGLFANPALTFQFAADKVGVAQSGDLAYARGPFRLMLKDPQGGAPLIRTGSYIRVYRRQDNGAWQAIETIATVGDSVDRPLPPH